jgi:plasmid maintenance system antidote protein VapI
MSPKMILMNRFQVPLGCKVIDRVLNNEPIDQKMAESLARMYDTSIEFWINAQRNYEASAASDLDAV